MAVAQAGGIGADDNLVQLGLELRTPYAAVHADTAPLGRSYTGSHCRQSEVEPGGDRIRPARGAAAGGRSCRPASGGCRRRGSYGGGGGSVGRARGGAARAVGDGAAGAGSV